MIEDEIRQEIRQEQADRMEEPYLFPKKEWDELKIHWKPVSKFSIDDIYKDLPEAKRFHESYVKMWLKQR